MATYAGTTLGDETVIAGFVALALATSSIVTSSVAYLSSGGRVGGYGQLFFRLTAAAAGLYAAMEITEHLLTEQFPASWVVSIVVSCLAYVSLVRFLLPDQFRAFCAYISRRFQIAN